MANKYKVRFVKPYRWSIWCDDICVEGGFFSKAAAEAYLVQNYKE